MLQNIKSSVQAKQCIQTPHICQIDVEISPGKKHFPEKNLDVPVTPRWPPWCSLGDLDTRLFVKKQGR